MKHLTQEQRYTIEVMHKQGHTQQHIAEAIGKHKSTVSRELKRNCERRNKRYTSALAHRKYKKKLTSKRKKVYFTTAIRQYAEEKLALKYSPEQIVGIAKQEGTPCVSHERLYQWLWSDKKQGGVHYKHLRMQGKRYRKRGAMKDKRGLIRNRVSIEVRPTIVDDRQRIGDLEIDTIIGKNHKGAILTINDRATGELKMKKLGSKNADELAQATLDVLMDRKAYLKTITADNGKEFAAHEKIAKGLNVISILLTLIIVGKGGAMKISTD